MSLHLGGKKRNAGPNLRMYARNNYYKMIGKNSSRYLHDPNTGESQNVYPHLNKNLNIINQKPKIIQNSKEDMYDQI